MKQLNLLIIITAIAFAGCKEETIDPFAVAKHNVGFITDSTKISELKTIFANDSIVTYKEDDSFVGGINTIDIYKKNGNQLLSISPTEALDSTATINTISIFDPRFKTSKNISISSTFKEIKDNYKISRISNLINSVVVSVDELDATFTIDKKELPANMRFDMSMKIDAIQIPDNAKIKFFMMHF